MRALRIAIVALLGATSCKADKAATASMPFTDDFERAELGPNWFPSGGDWKLRDNQVYTTFANNQPLFLNVDLPDDVVVEVDIQSDTAEVDCKIELMTDGRRHQSGYVFILGGWKNQLSVIARLDEHGDDRKVRKPTSVVGKRSYRWRIEKRAGHLRWYLDGEPYMEYQDAQPIHGPGHNRLAFGNWQNTLRLDNLKVWALADAPPVKTSTTGGLSR